MLLLEFAENGMALNGNTNEKMANEKICDELENFLEVNTKDLLNYIAGENVLKPYLPTATTESSKSNYVQYENDFKTAFYNGKEI